MVDDEDNEGFMLIVLNIEGGYVIGLVILYYVGLGFDNYWYMFIGGLVKFVYNNLFIFSMNLVGECVGIFLRERLWIGFLVWVKVGELGIFLCYVVWNGESGVDIFVWVC